MSSSVAGTTIAQLGLGALQIFELAAPFDVIAGRQLHLLARPRAARLGDIAAEIAAVHIDIDVGDELRVLGADASAVPASARHRATWPSGTMAPLMRRHQHLRGDRLRIVAQIARIAHD